MTTPEASASGLALSSSTSASSRIDSSSSSRLVRAFAETSTNIGVAAPLLRLEAELRHLRADAVGLRALLVDLVDRDDHRHLGGLRVVDGLARLRLHAVVGRHHDHRDVGDLGAAGAHRREGLVARRVEERDDLVVGRVDLVGADVLGDAAGLARGHLGLADRVEQRRLAVVDVAHDRDDGRRAARGPRRRRRTSGSVVLLVGDVDDLDLLVELVGEDLDRVVGQRLGERGHLPQLHELLDDLGDGDAQVLGDVLDRRAGVDLDDVRLQHADVLRAPAPCRCRAGAGHRAAAGAAAGRRRGRPGPPPGPPGPPWRREAWESMTTRRTPPAEPGARSPWSEERVGGAGRRCGGRRAAAVAAAGRRLPAWPRAGAWASASCPRAGGRRGRGCRDRRPGAAACAAAASAWRRWLGTFLPVSAASARVSSTADAAALTAMPAAFSRFMTSAVGMLYCLASSLTRFLAMCE